MIYYKLPMLYPYPKYKILNPKPYFRIRAFFRIMSGLYLRSDPYWEMLMGSPQTFKRSFI